MTLDASGYLLLAKAHLERAQQERARRNQIYDSHYILSYIEEADWAIRNALEGLRREKEQTDD